MVAPVDGIGAAIEQPKRTVLHLMVRQVLDAIAQRKVQTTWLTQDLFMAVCDKIAEGQTLRSIAKEMGFSESGFRFIVASDSRLAAHVADCRQCQADAWGDEIVEIADDRSDDTKTVNRNGTETELTDYENINRSKLRVDTRKWLMGKIAPKRYGELLTVDQKLTHEVGDSVQSLLAGIRGDRQDIQEAEIVQSLPIAAPEQPGEIRPAGGF